MIINFDKIEETSSPNFFGGEKEYRSRMFIDDYGKIVKGRLIPGASIWPPSPGWISPGRSELHRHQGEAALGYRWLGEHRRQNKHWTGSSLLGTITR